MTDNKTIKDWLADERPREKMLQKGAEALTDAELLAILIHSGTRKRTALDLAREVLGLAGNNVRQLGRLSVEELMTVSGIGEARAITLCAALELGRRRQVDDAPEQVVINGSRKAANILVPLLQDLAYEAFYVLYLNNSAKLIRTEKISMGGVTATIADTRIILKGCLLYNANRIIVAHNHPSGSKRPSPEDIQLTVRLREAAQIMDVKLDDHLIIAGTEYLSMADEGLM